MKSTDNDQALNAALQEWRVTPQRDAQFRAAVWERVAAAERAPGWGTYARAHPGLVAGTLAVAAVFGAMIGREQAQERVAADRAAVANSYVQALDARMMRMP